MKYEKTDPFESTDDIDKLIAQAMTNAKDTEAAEFLSSGKSDVEISEALERRILGLIDKRSAKETFRSKYYPKFLSSAALVTFVTLCFSFVAMMSTFVKSPGDISVPQPTDTTGGFLGSSSYSDSFSSQNAFIPGDESTIIMGRPNRQTEMTDPGRSESTGKPQGNTTPVHGETPADEQKVFYIITQGNRDGIYIKISIAGYQSESLGKEFYVKSNEYFTVTVEVKNISATTMYRSVRTDCPPDGPPHTHEDFLALSFRYQSLCSSAIGFDCGASIAWVPLKSGESYTYQLKYAAGKESASDFDLPGDGNDHPAGIKLYDETFLPFVKGFCTFAGNFCYDYRNTTEAARSFCIPLSVEVLYVKP